MRELFFDTGYVYIKHNVGRALVTGPLHPIKKITASLDKETIAATGEEFTTITFRTQEFDLATETFINTQESVEIKIDINGIKGSVYANSGVAVMEFDADFPGEFIIKTENGFTINAEVRVVAA